MKHSTLYQAVKRSKQPLPECPHEEGSYQADRWAHTEAARLCGLGKPLTRIEDYGTRGKRAAAAGDLAAELRRLARHYGPLLFITVNHPTGLDARSITDGRGTAWLKATLPRLGPDGWGRIEFGGRSTGLHLHGIIPVKLLNWEQWRQLQAEGYDVHTRFAEVSRDALYVCKSPYSDTAITDYHRHVTVEECITATLAYLEGLKVYQDSTGKSQTPDGQGWICGRPSSRGLGWEEEGDKRLGITYDPSLDPYLDHDPYTDRDSETVALLDEVEQMLYHNPPSVVPEPLKPGARLIMNRAGRRSRRAGQGGRLATMPLLPHRKPVKGRARAGAYSRVPP